MDRPGMDDGRTEMKLANLKQKNANILLLQLYLTKPLCGKVYALKSFRNRGCFKLYRLGNDFRPIWLC